MGVLGPRILRSTLQAIDLGWNLPRNIFWKTRSKLPQRFCGSFEHRVFVS